MRSGKWYNDNTSVVGEDEETPNHYPIPSHAKGKMGAIHTVFGGGNAAKVMGNTTVNIATQAEVYIVKEVTAGELCQLAATPAAVQEQQKVRLSTRMPKALPQMEPPTTEAGRPGR